MNSEQQDLYQSRESTSLSIEKMSVSLRSKVSGSPNADLQQGSAINDRNRARDATTELCALVTRPDPSTFARDTKDERKRGLEDHRKTKSSTNVFDVTRDLVIRHYTDLDLIESLVVMKCGIPVTGEATTHDRAEDVGVAC
jgi:hypothetical protein